MALAALAQSEVHTSLWDLKDEVEMGHIELSRSADFILVCPATADLLAKMAAGIADELSTTLLLATDKKVIVAPAMNVRMWQHPATQRNVSQLKADGVLVIEPDEGVAAIGSGGTFAQSAATALLRHTEMNAKDVAENALKIAAEICIYTNNNISVETVGS
jgi:phosphopantothenoylcysteine decarboxylase/phosphopantothenate--cysteine ligase